MKKRPMKKLDEVRLKRSKTFYIGLILFFACFGIFALWAMKDFIFPTIVGALLAYLCKPLLNSFKYEFIPNTLRLFIILCFTTSVVFLFTWQIRDAIPNQQEKLEIFVRMQYKFNEKYKSLFELNEVTGKGNMLYQLLGGEVEPLRTNINRFLSLPLEEQEKFENLYKNNISAVKMDPKIYSYYLVNKETFYSKLNNDSMNQQKKTSGLMQEQHISSKFLDTLSAWLIMPLVFLFLLFDKGDIKRYFISLVPNRYFEMTLTIIDEVDQAIGTYLRGTFVECMVVAACIILGFMLFGMKLKVAILIGLIAGFTNAIPFLGPIIGVSVGLAYALIAEDVSPLLPFLSADFLFVGVIITIGAVHMLDNVIFQPLILGGAVNLHPLVVILGVMGGATVFGVPGMVLAIPALVILKVVTETLVSELKAYGII
jgi:predicted PurR-regulated permease PerM